MPLDCAKFGMNRFRFDEKFRQSRQTTGKEQVTNLSFCFNSGIIFDIYTNSILINILELTNS